MKTLKPAKHQYENSSGLSLEETTHLTNITLEFLPPTTIAHFQPFVILGTISKVIFTQSSQTYDNFNEYGTEPVELILKSASNMLHMHGIVLRKLPLKTPKDDDGDEVRDDDLYLTHMNELEEIQMLIDKLDFENPFFTAEEFIQYDRDELQRK
ncbi:hypothetical protein C1646_759078 [Rhizophagus diaphanus]|nr:hypothetical protein C1646_759078 [Rhizophagus diaphanus] [Rhizophagus sp. MUCL 43196]